MIDSNVITCIVLWAVFGFQHSILARPTTKQFVKTAFGTTFETHFYPFLYFLSQCIIFVAFYDLIRHLKPSIVFFTVPDDYEYIIYALKRIANVFLIVTVCHFYLARFTGAAQLLSFFAKTSKRQEQSDQTATLNSSYLYKYIRHPMYLGILLVFPSSTTIYTELFFINLICIMLYIEIGSHYEEKTLLKQFGERYAEYKKTTKRYIPKIR